MHTNSALFASIVSLGVLFNQPSQAQPVIEGPQVQWNLSTWGTSRAFTAGIEEVTKLVRQHTGGKFNIKIHYGEVLSKSRENLDGISIGAFEAATVCSFFHPGKNPAAMVLSLPFLPIADWHVSKHVREAAMRHPTILAEMQRWGAKPYLSTLQPIFQVMGTGTPPRRLVDWEGKRVRAAGAMGRAMEKLGATPISVPSTEVFTAIERGTIDAAAFPYYAHAAYQVHTVADWFTSNLSPGSGECNVVFNIDAYDKLPKQYKQLLEDVKEQAYEAQIRAYQESDTKDLATFKSGLTEIRYSDEELAEFRERAGRPVWNDWVKDNQRKFDAEKLLKFILAEIEEANTTRQ